MLLCADCVAHTNSIFESLLVDMDTLGIALAVGGFLCMFLVLESASDADESSLLARIGT